MKRSTITALMVVIMVIVILVLFSVYQPEESLSSNDVYLDIIFEKLDNPIQREYEGIVIGLDRIDNSTQLSFADGSIIDSNGNIIQDPEKTIRVGAKLFIIYEQSSPICNATVEFSNGTKIVGFKGELNADLYNIIPGNITEVCVSGQVIKKIIQLQILE